MSATPACIPETQRFSDLGTFNLPESRAAAIRAVNAALREFSGQVTFFEQLNLWQCVYALRAHEVEFGGGPWVFEIRLWSDTQGGLFIGFTRASGDDLDGGKIGADLDGRDLSAGELGPNEVFFRALVVACDQSASLEEFSRL